MRLGQRRADLQGTGQAVSVPHTRTHALDLSVCMASASKIACHAVAVAGVPTTFGGIQVPALACPCNVCI
jgi:hypothetical protein